MSDPGAKLQTLLSVSSQAEAKRIVAALADYGVNARSSEAASGSPSSVATFQVVVVGQDAERAVGAIQNMQATCRDIDWSHVDVGPVGGQLS